MMSKKNYPFEEIIEQTKNETDENSCENLYYAVGYKKGISDSRTYEQFINNLGEHFGKDYARSYTEGWIDGQQNRPVDTYKYEGL